MFVELFVGGLVVGGFVVVLLLDLWYFGVEVV